MNDREITDNKLQPAGSESTTNYPPPGDSTSEGGYGGDAFSKSSQNGLVDQSYDGGPIGAQIQDAKQGADQETREAYQEDQRVDSKGLNPYSESYETKAEVENKLAAQMRDDRGR